ncbi:MAG: GAF domain-containing protein, partial [Anaerolineales bacterium]
MSIKRSLSQLETLFSDVAEPDVPAAPRKKPRRRAEPASAPSGWVWEFDVDGTSLWSSNEIRSLLGLSASKVKGKSFEECGLLPESAQKLRAAIDTGEPIDNLFLTASHHNGSMILLLMNALPRMDEDGQVSMYRAVVQVLQSAAPVHAAAPTKRKTPSAKKKKAPSRKKKTQPVAAVPSDILPPEPEAAAAPPKPKRRPSRKRKAAAAPEAPTAIPGAQPIAPRKRRTAKATAVSTAAAPETVQPAAAAAAPARKVSKKRKPSAAKAAPAAAATKKRRTAKKRTTKPKTVPARVTPQAETPALPKKPATQPIATAAPPVPPPAAPTKPPDRPLFTTAKKPFEETPALVPTEKPVVKPPPETEIPTEPPQKIITRPLPEKRTAPSITSILESASLADVGRQLRRPSLEELLPSIAPSLKALDEKEKTAAEKPTPAPSAQEGETPVEIILEKETSADTADTVPAVSALQAAAPPVMEEKEKEIPTGHETAVPTAAPPIPAESHLPPFLPAEKKEIEPKAAIPPVESAPPIPSTEPITIPTPAPQEKPPAAPIMPPTPAPNEKPSTAPIVPPTPAPQEKPPAAAPTPAPQEKPPAAPIMPPTPAPAAERKVAPAPAEKPVPARKAASASPPLPKSGPLPPFKGTGPLSLRSLAATAQAGTPFSIRPVLFHDDAGGLQRLEAYSSPETQRALSSGELVILQPGDDGNYDASSVMAVPIRMQDQILGVLEFRDEEGKRIWTEEDRMLAEEITNQLALALENARLFHQAAARTQELALINRIVSSVAGSLDLLSSLDTIASELARILSLGHASISLLSEDKSTLTLVSDQPGRLDRSNPTIFVSAKDSPILQKALVERGPTIFTGLSENPLRPLLPGEKHEHRTRTLVLLPLVAEGNTIGLVGMHLLEEGRSFTSEELRLSETIVAQASTAIQNARLHNQTEQALREAVTLFQTSQRLQKASGEEQLMQEALDSCRTAVNLNSISIQLFGEETGQTYVQQVAHLADDDQPSVEDGTRFPGVLYPFFDLLQSGQTVVSNHAQDDDRLSGMVRPVLADLAIASMVAVPLRVRGENIGILQAVRRMANPFSHSEVRFLETVGAQLSVALDNYRLLNQAQRRAQQLEIAAEVSRLATSTLETGTLLSRAVNLLRERFGFYHAAIFLLDEQGKYAVVQEATGQPGVQMKEAKHSIAVGSRTIIGQVTESGKPYAALDTSQDPLYRAHPSLPDTKTQLGLPLKIGDRMLGALDIHV